MLDLSQFTNLNNFSRHPLINGSGARMRGDAYIGDRYGFYDSDNPQFYFLGWSLRV